MLTTQHIEEGISRAYVQAVASVAGINTGSSNYDYGVDGTFSKIQIIGNRRLETGFKVDYQLKATINWQMESDKIVYALEAKTYNDLVERNRRARVAPLILILLCRPKNEREWLKNDEECLLLKKCCYWTTIPGNPTENQSKAVIRISRDNVLTPSALDGIFNAVEKGIFRCAI